MESDDLPEDLVHCPECAKPVKAKAIVIHFRRAHGRLPPGRRISDPKSAATLLTAGAALVQVRGVWPNSNF